MQGRKNKSTDEKVQFNWLFFLFFFSTNSAGGFEGMIPNHLNKFNKAVFIFNYVTLK